MNYSEFDDMIKHWEKKNETHCLWCESMIPWKDERSAIETKDGLICSDCQQIKVVRRHYKLDE